MAGEFTYATDLFDASTVQAFADRFLRILAAVVADPDTVVGDIDLLGAEEIAQLTGPAGLDAPAPTPLPDLLAAAADSDPEALALVAGVEELTYRELDERSTRLARLLVSRGAGPEDVIAVALTRSVESVTAVWAVAKSGAAFAPVDPNYPRDRVAHMVSDSGAVLGVTTSEHADALPDGLPWLVLDDAAVAAGLAEQSVDRLSNADRVRPSPRTIPPTSSTRPVPRVCRRESWSRTPAWPRSRPSRWSGTASIPVRGHCILHPRASTHRSWNCLWPSVRPRRW